MNQIVGLKETGSHHRKNMNFALILESNKGKRSEFHVNHISYPTAWACINTWKASQMLKERRGDAWGAKNYYWNGASKRKLNKKQIGLVRRCVSVAMDSRHDIADANCYPRFEGVNNRSMGILAQVGIFTTFEYRSAKLNMQHPLVVSTINEITNERTQATIESDKAEIERQSRHKGVMDSLNRIGFKADMGVSIKVFTHGNRFRFHRPLTSGNIRNCEVELHIDPDNEEARVEIRNADMLEGDEYLELAYLLTSVKRTIDLIECSWHLFQ